jgi:Zn-dependent M28 family amino/carboxypeptidase
MTWLDAKGVPANNFPSLQCDATISMAAAPKLFARTGIKPDDIYAAAAANKPLPHVDLQLSMKAMRSATRSDIKSSNVVGMIEGSDPKLKSEYVVFSAHLDHLGVKPEKQGDNIFNGAMDNASGVATLLEMARMFSQSPVKPKRSILFIALTGEEKGLLGSAYFANNPTVPASAIVADVNLDMPLLTYNFSSVIAFGAEHSSLKDNVARAAKQLNVSLMKDPWPEQVAFVRSDHYNFVKQGIPAISLGTGTTSFNKNEDGAKAWEDFETHHYHQPSDDMSLPFNFDAAARFAQLNFNIALDVANAKERPSWNKGDFFGDTFKK